MHVGYSQCLKDVMACKTKWNILIPDYHQIADFHAKVGTNEVWYWNITIREHVQIRLSKISMKVCTLEFTSGMEADPKCTLHM